MLFTFLLFRNINIKNQKKKNVVKIRIKLLLDFFTTRCLIIKHANKVLGL